MWIFQIVVIIFIHTEFHCEHYDLSVQWSFMLFIDILNLFLPIPYYRLHISTYTPCVHMGSRKKGIFMSTSVKSVLLRKRILTSLKHPQLNIRLRFLIALFSKTSGSNYSLNVSCECVNELTVPVPPKIWSF